MQRIYQNVYLIYDKNTIILSNNYNKLKNYIVNKIYNN